MCVWDTVTRAWTRAKGETGTEQSRGRGLQRGLRKEGRVHLSPAQCKTHVTVLMYPSAYRLTFKDLSQPQKKDRITQGLANTEGSKLSQFNRREAAPKNGEPNLGQADSRQRSFPLPPPLWGHSVCMNTPWMAEDQDDFRDSGLIGLRKVRENKEHEENRATAGGPRSLTKDDASVLARAVHSRA